MNPEKQLHNLEFPVLTLQTPLYGKKQSFKHIVASSEFLSDTEIA